MEKKHTILIIEDEKDLCEFLADELDSAGYNVITANNGEDGLEKIHDIFPDLIICDRAMPRMSGYDLLERMRGVYPQYKSIPFIFLTALTDKRDRMSVDHLNPTAYLEKPVDLNKLILEISKALKI